MYHLLNFQPMPSIIYSCLKAIATRWWHLCHLKYAEYHSILQYIFFISTCNWQAMFARLYLPYKKYASRTRYLENLVEDFANFQDVRIFCSLNHSNSPAHLLNQAYMKLCYGVVSVDISSESITWCTKYALIFFVALLIRLSDFISSMTLKTKFSCKTWHLVRRKVNLLIYINFIFDFRLKQRTFILKIICVNKLIPWDISEAIKIQHDRPLCK